MENRIGESVRRKHAFENCIECYIRKAEIERHEPIIATAEKELPIAEAHLAKAQTVLGEAVLPGKVDVILPQNEFNQAISRATAL